MAGGFAPHNHGMASGSSLESCHASSRNLPQVHPRLGPFSSSAGILPRAQSLCSLLDVCSHNPSTTVSDGILGERAVLSHTASSSSGAAWRALRAWKPKTLPWLILLETAELGLTSSSLPWSHPIHLWTCNGCSCPQSTMRRSQLTCPG